MSERMCAVHGQPEDDCKELVAVRLAFLAARWDVGDFLSCTKPPAPDVLLSSPDGPIGIEVTRVLPQGFDAMREQGSHAAVVKNALRLYQGPPVLANVVLQPGWLPTGKQAKETSAEVARVIAAAAHVDPMQLVELTLENDDILPDGVLSIHLRRMHDGTLPGFFDHRAAWEVQLTNDQLVAAVARKERRLKDYFPGLMQCWLLITVGGEFPAGWGQLPGAIHVDGLTSGFDRILVADLLRVGVIELDYHRGGRGEPADRQVNRGVARQ